MTTEETKSVLMLLLAAYTTQRQRMDPENVREMFAAYAAGLGDLDASLVRAAVQRLVRTSQWLPTIAEIREACGVVVHGTQKTGGEAWGAVVRAIGAQGSHRTPGEDFVFTDPLTARVVKALGWAELCRSDNSVADRARFIDTYEQMAKNERTEAKATDGAVSKVLPLRPATATLGEAAMRVLDEARRAEGLPPMLTTTSDPPDDSQTSHR